jgi:S1-C subfamily serine protease
VSAEEIQGNSSPSALVREAENSRVEMIERVSPSVVCVYDKNLRGGGSGVLIDEEGYGLTNYHVVAGLMESRRGWAGLGDGVLYELEVLGIDVTGDVAMFRLIPPKSGHRFPFARLGDSDRVQVGDAALAMGNPFILSEDYTPTVTMGIVTGVHRYQWGVKGNLTYSDCIQIDAPINPGNSGGPLFNLDGEVVGINGRISVNTRGRLNVGFGYAIATKQIRRFIPALRAGLLAMHGTWEARVDETASGLAFADVRPSGPAGEAGVRGGDRLLALDGVAINSANQVVSILGTYPARWPLVATVQREGELRDLVFRLSPVQPKLRHPFEPNRDASIRQVRRVLREYQRQALLKPAVPSNWKWTITRQHRPTAIGSGHSCETFEVVQPAEGRGRMQQKQDDGAAGRTVEYDALTAIQLPPDGGEAFPLPIDQRMILGALFRAHQWLRQPSDEVDVSDATHVGGDRWLPPLLDAAAPPNDADRSAARSERLVEVLEWPVAEQAVGRFAFDADTFALVRISVRDRLGGAAITIDLSDHREVGGVRWPTTMHVYGAGHDFRDLLTDWESTP